MDTKVRSLLILSTFHVKKYYKFLDLFQIFPAPSAAPRPSFAYGHYPCIIEINCEDNEFQNMLLELCTMLNVFSRAKFIYSHFGGGHDWFLMEEENEPPTTIWAQKDYWFTEYNSSPKEFSTDNNIENIELIESAKYFTDINVTPIEEFKLPSDIDLFFQYYFNLEEKCQKSFLSACKLFNYGIDMGRKYPSLAYASFISAIETLIVIDNTGVKNPRCKECGQEQYKLTQKFKAFIKKYSGMQYMSEDKVETLAKDLYNKRSKILHCGHLMLGEIALIPHDKQSERDAEFKENMQLLDLISICRLCLLNWLFANYSKFKAADNALEFNCLQI